MSRSDSAVHSAAPHLDVLLASVLSTDRPGLARALRGLKGRPRSAEELPPALRARIEASAAARAARRAALPQPDFAPELPVNQRREEIAAAIRDHQVVIVCGETGSGKTTQLPKICLALGRGEAGLIGHTQPRRIAARATAGRIAQELHSELGRVVGYKVRFTDRTGPDAYVKLMTDGILLAETQGDPLLSAYDTLIIDEAHERSLNIDFLLGYLRRLLPRRPDLKLIVTSATLDAERFARHFAQGEQPAPVIEVSGRLFPIEIRYRPLEDEAQAPTRAVREPVRAASGRREARADLFEALADAVDELQREGPGDVLVFLPGEREIREAAEALRKRSHPAGLASEILPLFARQSAQEQARVFAPHPGRRVVLATNVAETSLTVPGIRYVVDSGLARVNRYSIRNKVEQLQIEKIAQSAARQRAGRCGRVADGVCIRLYAEDDFGRRPPHTDPEILRSSLAGVILRMKSLRLGEPQDFPFIDPPPPRAIADGYQLLLELGAVEELAPAADAAAEARERWRLTPVGQELARLPLDPKIGRMILAARERGCLREVLVIAAALSVQDPRERPPESPGAADQAHARFRLAPEAGAAEPRSEFLWYWNLWCAADQVWRHEGSGKQKSWCRQHFLSWLRMREWRDIHGQLHALCAEHGWVENPEPASFEAIHKALLAGLLGHIGCRIEDAEPKLAGAYLGARAIRFWLHPGSFLAKKAGKWLMAAELIDTSRLYARCIARIEPEWVEEVGAHLLRRQVFEPHWEKRAGAVRAWERGVLHGITLYARRPAAWRGDAKVARELFLREGLVAGELEDAVARRLPFLAHNRRLVAEIEHLEHKTRRPDVLVDEGLIEAFYDAQIPATICDLASFEVWWREAGRADPKRLHLVREQLMRHEAAGVTTEAFPAQLEVLGQRLRLSYLHEPGAADDGVSLAVPLAMLNQVPAARCEWLVPGLLEEKLLQLLKTVPQKHRHRLQPLQESARAFLAALDDGSLERDDSLLRTLQRFIEERVQLKLPLESFRLENLPPHCFMNFRVIDAHGRLLAQSRNLAELRGRLRDQVAAAFRAAQVAPQAEPAPVSAAPAGEPVGEPTAPARYEGLTDWDFGALPELLELKVGGREVIGFPALVDCTDSVALRAFDTPEEAARSHRAGLARLFALKLRDQVKAIEKLSGLRELALQFLSWGSEAELKAQLVAATLARTCLLDPLPSDGAAFAERAQQARPRITLVAQELMRLAATLLSEHAQLTKRLTTAARAHPEAVADIQAQLSQLMPRNFLLAQPYERLANIARYLKAAGVRLDKLRANPARDAQLLADWKRLAQPWEREALARAKAGVADPQLEEFRWLLEELRVSLFAQELKTPVPVSVKRLEKIWAARAR